MPLHQISSVTV